ncbi:hypothetical protein [Acinetobacter radioresistens]|uniref:hypothetical protein n=1 Tax=Acinetobacter TaxID=469 RepID=UPI0021CD5995|nr:hypothetical protein [Acinetobacter radioresistens]MCU4499963.1 hypothetical protein [Acinetobacter radioresistens]
MATDVDVQFFSHLNGLVLDNNWGDLIRLLDTCLVNGLPLTAITSATIDAQGDITLNLYADHKCLLFQIIELTGFAPNELNGKYRIKGIPSANQLILKATHTGKSITTTGTAKLAPLGYEIIFRDPNDVKRVYRAKDPSAQHPFIRVDETISDGVNSYNSAYAKYAMVGLIEHMTHIDDYTDPDKLQLPLDTSDFKKNWKITGTGDSVVRGWAKWYWATDLNYNDYFYESNVPGSAHRTFTLCGDKDVFYLMLSAMNQYQKQVFAAGIYESALDITNWFLFATMDSSPAYQSRQFGALPGGAPLTINQYAGSFLTVKNSIIISNHVKSYGVMPDSLSGGNTNYNNQIAALDIPIFDEDKYLLGTLKHIKYMGRPIESQGVTPVIAGKSMYIKDNVRIQAVNQSSTGGFYFYLGELE